MKWNSTLGITISVVYSVSFLFSTFKSELSIAHQKEHRLLDICFAWVPMTKSWKYKKMYQRVHIYKGQDQNSTV